MKVVLFCGGQGMRIRDYSEEIPKPMIPIGVRPIMLHIMKYYAYYGHKEFILCLGYKGDVIKKYFLNYQEAIPNDFVLKDGGQKIHVINKDIDDLEITFVDTGLYSNIGQRLVAVKKYLDDDEIFMANYADQVSDIPLDNYLDFFKRKNKIASFISVYPSASFHVVESDENSFVRKIQLSDENGIRINGGFFIFKKEIFDYIEEGEELVNEPFQRLIDKQELITRKYDGFWAAMDTFKEKQFLDEMYAKNNAPWALWKKPQTKQSQVISQ